MTLAAARPLPRVGLRGLFDRRLRTWTAMSGVTLLGLVILSAYLMPLAYMTATSLKDAAQMSEPGAPLYPAKPSTFQWQGQEYAVYKVPTADGVHEWALVDPRREDATFVDPAHPENGTIEWQGRWRTLEQAWQFGLQLENFVTVWNQLNFARLLFNTFAIALIGTLGTLLSSTAVAYGFSRFRFPGKNGLFLLLLATIILPFQITLIPTFAVFLALGWTGTWLPLLVPHFFANAYNVFLLRQYFVTIPRELDEAAIIDGAGSLRLFFRVVFPLLRSVAVTVIVVQSVVVFNDFTNPLYFLPGDQNATVQLTLFNFQSQYATQYNLLFMNMLLITIPPLLMFLFFNRHIVAGLTSGAIKG